MGDPAILIYGSVENPALVLINNHLRQRGKRRVVFQVQERFPRDVGLYLGNGPTLKGSVLMPDSDEPLLLEDVVSVCLDGFYISQEGLREFTPEDLTYLQTESWAALIAMFYRLSRHCLVANHVIPRDLVASRWSELCLLSHHGLEIPRTLITSDGEALAAFAEELSGKVVCKPVTGVEPTFRRLEPSDLEQPEKLALAPVHFEEEPEGEVCRAVVIGTGVEVQPAESEPPPQAILGRCLAVCRELELHMAEVALRRTSRGWLATGLRRFLSPEILAEEATLEKVARLLEEGR
ncbi:MAG: hypothetical protein HY319_10910 [Armatimonadetes bacterium]|nr:hypothetical protein [Armatimonadota bacterium]